MLRASVRHLPLVPLLFLPACSGQHDLTHTRDVENSHVLASRYVTNRPLVLAKDNSFHLLHLYPVDKSLPPDFTRVGSLPQDTSVTINKVLRTEQLVAFMG